MTAIVGRVALSAVALVLAACGGHPAAGMATPSPVVSSPRPTSGSATAGVLRFPAQLLGLSKNTTAHAEQVASSLDREAAAKLKETVTGAQAVFYGRGQDGFLVDAGTWVRRVASPAKIANGLRAVMLAKGAADIMVFPADPDDRALACGQLHYRGRAVIMCFWADHVSFGMAVYYPGFASSLRDGAAKTRQIASAVVR